MGAITPLGNDVKTTWENALAGKSGSRPITHFDASLFKTQFACEVKDFNPPSDLFDRKEARKYDRYAQLAIKAAKEAMENSGLDLEKEDTSRIGGVIFSAGGSEE